MISFNFEKISRKPSNLTSKSNEPRVSHVSTLLDTLKREGTVRDDGAVEILASLAQECRGASADKGGLASYCNADNSHFLSEGKSVPVILFKNPAQALEVYKAGWLTWMEHRKNENGEKESYFVGMPETYDKASLTEWAEALTKPENRNGLRLSNGWEHNTDDYISACRG